MSVTITNEGLRDRREGKGTHGPEVAQNASTTTPMVRPQNNQSSTEEDSVPNDACRASLMSSVKGEVERQKAGCLRRNFGLHKGLFFALMSCIFNSLNSIGVKMLAGRIPAPEIVLARLVMYVVCSTVCLAYLRVPPTFTRQQVLWLLIRVTVGTTFMCLSYYAFQNIPVGDTSAILYSSPIFTGFFAWIILGEKFTLADSALAVVTLSGIVLIARPSFIFGSALHASSSKDGNTVLGVIAAVVGAICVSLVYVLMRKLGGINVHPFLQIWFFGFVGIILGSGITTVFGAWVMPRCGRERFILILTSFFGFLAQLCLTIAFRYEKATYVAMIKTNTVILSFVLEFAILGTVPFWLSVIGAVLIMCSAIGITFKKWLSASKKLDEADDEVVSEADDR